MPIFRLRERVLRLEASADPSFPCEVELNGRLLPAVPFGGVAGPSRNVVAGTQVNARANLSTARFTVEHPAPLFDELDASTEYDGGTFRIQGNTATATAECQGRPALIALIETFLLTFPAVLSQRLPDVPYVAYAWGRLDGQPFKIQYEPTDVRGSATVTSRDHQGQTVVDAWEWALALADEPRLRLGC